MAGRAVILGVSTNIAGYPMLPPPPRPRLLGIEPEILSYTYAVAVAVYLYDTIIIPTQISESKSCKILGVFIYRARSFLGFLKKLIPVEMLKPGD